MSRIVAVSSDHEMRARIVAALRGVAPTFEATSLAAVIGTQATLCVLHSDHEAAPSLAHFWPQLGECRVIAVVPRADLADVVDMMSASERVVGMIVAEELDPLQLGAMAARVLSGQLFGLAKVMPAGTKIHTLRVQSGRDRASCLQSIADAAEAANVRRKYHASIEQCLDEMLMNALFDAPFDDHGQPVFANVSVQDRTSLSIGPPVVVQHACDGRQFAISVRDAWGTLKRATVLRVLHKCLHSDQKIDRKASGAGIGLYLIVSSATSVYFHIVPGVATEAICMFDLSARAMRLRELGCFVEPRDVTGKLPVTRRPRAGVLARPERRFGRAIAIGAALALVALGGVVAWPRLFRSQPPPPPEVHAATVELDSQPTGANVEIDGKPVGVTPMTLRSLRPASIASVVFKQPGYQDVTVSVNVPAAGGSKRVVQPLAASDRFVTVHFTSKPEGARIMRLPPATESDHTYTPANVIVEADRVQQFMLTMPKHAPVLIEPFTTPHGSPTVEKSATLAAAATLRVEAASGGTVTIAGAPQCRELTAPADCALAPGTYTVEVVGTGGAKATRSITVGNDDLTVKFD